ncbi:hypothetical protein [Streptomyces sp. NPDC055085]
MANTFDTWAWGFCNHCKFMIPLNAEGQLPAHNKDGRQSNRPGCHIPTPADEVEPAPYQAIPSLAEAYEALNEFVTRCNELPADVIGFGPAAHIAQPSTTEQQSQSRGGDT